MKEDKNREIGKLVKEMTEGLTAELKAQMIHIDLSPEIPDAKIKQAILSISRQGMEKLFQRFGQQSVMSFIRDFSEGRRW